MVAGIEGVPTNGLYLEHSKWLDESEDKNGTEGVACR